MLKIGDFAKIFDISIKTVRFYESVGLIVPAHVDVYSGYRYFDEDNVIRMNEILSLKELGFSLEEIKYFNEEEVPDKILDYEKKILNIKSQIEALKELSFKGREVLKMRKFINDERVIGKWKLIGVSENLQNAKNGKFMEDDYQIKELYLLPEGKKYWVISWTKDSVYISGRECHYQLDNHLMYLTINGSSEEEESKIAVYEKIDNRKYDVMEIKVKDNTNLDFVKDDDLVGFWNTVDFIVNKNSFNPFKLQSMKGSLPLQKLTFTPDGQVYINYKGNEEIKGALYTKDFIINLCLKDTVSKYFFQIIEGKTYLIVEWKSGDYVFGGMINGYYVLEKVI